MPRQWQYWTRGSLFDWKKWKEECKTLGLKRDSWFYHVTSGTLASDWSGRRQKCSRHGDKQQVCCWIIFHLWPLEMDPNTYITTCSNYLTRSHCRGVVIMTFVSPTVQPSHLNRCRTNQLTALNTIEISFATFSLPHKVQSRDSLPTQRVTSTS